MKKLLAGLLFACLWFGPAAAANIDIPGLPAAASVTGTDMGECSQSGTSRRCTAAQTAAYIYGLMSGGATCTGVGVCTLSRATLAQIPQLTANSIFINPTGSTADAQSIAVPACANDGAHALVYVNGSGLACASVTGGGGAVSSVTAGCGLTISPTTGAVVASTNVTTTNNTGTTDTIASTACGTIVTENNAASVAVAITTAGFVTGNYFTVKDLGAGVATYTPSAGTIDGAATLVCKQNQSADLYFDGTNYKTLANNCGLGTAATANTGTSGATLPFLNGTNTFSGTQTFGSVFGTVTSQSGTTYTLASTDCGTEIAFTNAAAVTVTIPAALTTGCNIAILQTTAAGQVTVTGTAVSAANLHSAHSYTKTFGQWAIIGINIETTGVAILTGDGA